MRNGSTWSLPAYSSVCMYEIITRTPTLIMFSKYCACITGPAEVVG